MRYTRKLLFPLLVLPSRALARHNCCGLIEPTRRRVLRVHLPFCLQQHHCTTCKNLLHLRGGASTPEYHQQQQQRTMTTKIQNTDYSVWNGKDAEAFSSPQHPGYTLKSHPDTHLGGWLAHRAALEQSTEADESKDWIQEEVAPLITKFDYLSMAIGRAPKILVLYGSLRPTSFSRKLAYEFARLLELVGCDVRVYNPRGLPVRDPARPPGRTPRATPG
jgi:hypothetical protein